ncbi:hypothetical protein BZA77DRAFT_358073 [Pyronema omphalodes]|nr:hypothetical protein BZA77DRAFT_358073 [Pyronema omphalodes]
MPPTLLLENLPLEVLHHVLSNLSANELIPIRLVSVRLRDLATSNPHWRRCLLNDFVPSYVALYEISEIPPNLWSFTLAHDGWFKAYCRLKRVIRNPWLLREEDMIGAPWLVYFKQHMVDPSRPGEHEPHAVIRFDVNPEKKAKLIAGIPLTSRNWWLEGGTMRVSAYPPNIPGRVSGTLCRKLEHSTVAMVSDSPEFMNELVKLNNEIVEEAVRARILDRKEADRRIAALEQARLPDDLSSRNDRLRWILKITDELENEDEDELYEPNEREELEDEDEEHALMSRYSIVC